MHVLSQKNHCWLSFIQDKIPYFFKITFVQKLPNLPLNNHRECYFFEGDIENVITYFLDWDIMC